MKKKIVLIELDEDLTGKADQGDNLPPSQDSAKPAKKPNARLGVKRGPYKCRGKKKLTEAATTAAARGKKEDRDRDRGEAGAKTASKPNGVLGKRAAGKQAPPPGKKRRSSSESSGSRGRSSSSGEGSSSSSSNASSSNGSSSNSNMTTSELSHGSIDSERKRAENHSSSSAASNSSASRSQGPPRDDPELKNGTEKNKPTTGPKPQRKLVVQFDFLGGQGP